MRLYQRGGRWWAEGYYVSDDGGRKRWRRTTGVACAGAKSKRLAEQIGYHLASTLAAGVNRNARKVTIYQAVRALVEAREGRRSPATIDIYIQKSKNLLEHWGPSYPLESITADSLVEYVAAAETAERTGPKTGRAPRTIHRELHILAMAFQAVDMDPPRMPEMGKLSAPRDRWLTIAEQKALILACGPTYRDHVILYLRLGARKSELYRIEPDWPADAVHIHGTKTAGADRLVPMTPDVREVLRRVSLPMRRWKSGAADLQRAADKAGLGPLSFNDLRRSYATTMAREGADMWALASLLGHSSTRMVQEVYAHIGGSDRQREAVDTMPLLRENCAEYVPETTATVGSVDSDGEETP